MVGVDPRQRAAGALPQRLIPGTVDAAVQAALSENPNIAAARHALDAAQAQVRVVEGELVPTLGVQGAVNHRYDNQQSGDRATSAQIVARLEVPLYQAGGLSAQRDRVVAAYAVIQAMGRLKPTSLALSTPIYDPSVHFDQVEALWYGTRTPSGI